MVLVPETTAALGIGMGMLRPMIPQLRQARETLYALSPADQDEVAAMLVKQMRELPADQRGPDGASGFGLLSAARRRGCEGRVAAR